MDDETYTHLMLTIAQGFELVAAAVLVFGLIFAVILAARAWRTDHDGRVV